MTTNHKLEELKQHLSPGRRHLLDSAYELGSLDLDTKLAAKPRPAGTSPAALPDLTKNVAYHALMLQMQLFQLPTYCLDTKDDDRHIMKDVLLRTTINHKATVGVLAKLLRTADAEGLRLDAEEEAQVAAGTLKRKDAATRKEARQREAAIEYLDNFTAVLWEAMDAVLSCDDPVKAVSILRLMQEEGTAAIELAPDTQPQLAVA